MCWPWNSTIPSDGEIQRSNGGFAASLSTVTLIYVFFNGLIATRFGPALSFDVVFAVAAGVAAVVALAFVVVVAVALAKSSGRTGSARRISGSFAATVAFGGGGGGVAIATCGGAVATGVDT